MINDLTYLEIKIKKKKNNKKTECILWLDRFKTVYVEHNIILGDLALCCPNGSWKVFINQSQIPPFEKR